MDRQAVMGDSIGDSFFSKCKASFQSVYNDKRIGIGQPPIFSRAPYFYVKKHTTVVLKVEIWTNKGYFSLSSL